MSVGAFVCVGLASNGMTLAMNGLPHGPRTVPPVADDSVPRPRLLDRLDAGRETPLTLVAAPAGAGKTTLVAAWVRDGRPVGSVAWISLEGEGHGVDDLWALVAQALNGPRPRPRQRVDSSRGHIVNQLEGESEPVTLVFDDFQELGGAAAVADLEALLERTPSALRIVLISRRDPPLRLGRLRLAGRLTEIRGHDLAFTREETARLLSGGRFSLAQRDVDALWERTEGWVAGLRLAELTLRDHPRPPDFLRDFSGADGSVADYMLVEVLDQLPPRLRSFVLRTSLVDAVNGDLADALTDATGGAATLRRLTRDNAFLTPVEGTTGWFRYHPLLRDLLRVELRYERGHELGGLHRRAAEWLAKRGHTLPALRHAIRARAWDVGARVLARDWVELLTSGEIAAVRDLVDELEAESAAALPELTLACAAAAVEEADGAAAASLLRRAAEREAELPDARRADYRLALEALVLRHRLQHGDERFTLPDPPGAGGRPSTGRPDLEGLVQAERGLTGMWRGDRPSAVGALVAAVGAGESAGRPEIVALATAHLAQIDLHEGFVARAADRVAEALDDLERAGSTRTRVATALYATRGAIALLRNDLDLVQASVEKALASLVRLSGDGVFECERPTRTLLIPLRVRLLAAQGRLDAALGVLRFELDRDRPSLDANAQRSLEADEAMLLYALGERDTALARLEGRLADSPTAEVALALGRLRLAAGEHGEALRLAAVAGEPADAPGPLWTRIGALALRALACDGLADHEAAVDALERALDLAEPAGVLRPFVELGSGLQPLLVRRVQRGTAHRTLVDQIADQLDPSASAARAAASNGLPEPLSERELMVLRYLPTLMSNADIGHEIFISVNTVKSHLRQIYRKLDVTTRREAVERARRLHLLGPGRSAA